MRVLRFYAPRDVRVEDAPEPTAGPGDLLIRVRNCSVCGTDAKIWRSGHPNLRPPRVLGHEIAGEQATALEQAGCWPIVQEKISGAAKALPVRDEVLHMALAGDTITTVRLDRIGRSMVEVVRIIQDLERRGIRYRCTEQHVGKLDLVEGSADAAP